MFNLEICELIFKVSLQICFYQKFFCIGYFEDFNFQIMNWCKRRYFYREGRMVGVTIFEYMKRLLKRFFGFCGDYIIFIWSYYYELEFINEDDNIFYI